MHTDLYIFRRDTPSPWKLVKKISLPRQKALSPVSYRAPLGTGGTAEVWMVEAESEGAARARLGADLRAKTN